MIGDLHTVDDVRQLMRTAEFRIDRAGALVNRLPFTAENVKLVEEWDTFVDVRWKKAHDAVLASIVALKLQNPLVVEPLLPAEKEFQAILKAITATPGRTQTGDLSDLINRLQAASGEKLDETGAPPANFDPDLPIFLKADAAIKQGEAASAALAASLPSPNFSLTPKFSVPWWGWLLGIGVVGGVGYSVVKTGQQVNEKAQRDRKNLEEYAGGLTRKALPGYKG